MPHLCSYTPVRDIGMNSRSVTGFVPKFGKYESSLERDFIEILRFDPNVDKFIPQPLTIKYRDKKDKELPYTPDGLIFFSGKTFVSDPVLFEVKYRSDFRKDWKRLIPKFRAAKELCREKGWRFEVFTEREIRTPFLENAKFLWEYKSRIPEPEMVARILQILADLETTDPEMLLCALCFDATNRAALIPYLWHLIAIGDIGCDLDVPLTMHSIIWPVKEGYL